MARLKITGNPDLRLSGEVRISGSKNAALPAIAAGLLTADEVRLSNVPMVSDVRMMLTLIEGLGGACRADGNSVALSMEDIASYEASYELVRAMRASILVLGPLLARFGRAEVALPGGCAIGARPINYHLKGFEKLGAISRLEQGYVEAVVEGRMQGGTVYFDIPSVTGTENVLMASVVAQGDTIINNAAREPEVGNLVDMLVAMGAEIEGRDTDRLVVHGVERLHAAESTIIPDRIETGTYMIAVAATGGCVTVTDCNPTHLPALTDKLLLCGVEIEATDTTLTIACPEIDGRSRCRLRSVDVTTLPYPGFPTDLQAQFMALMAQGDGTSVIHETIFENRFMHVAELKRLGADIAIEGARAVVRGIGRDKLCGAPVMATDLRASASLVIAGLSAGGTTEISRIYHLERGYENMVEKLSGLGARVKKVRE